MGHQNLGDASTPKKFNCRGLIQPEFISFCPSIRPVRPMIDIPSTEPYFERRLFHVAQREFVYAYEVFFSHTVASRNEPDEKATVVVR